MSEQDLSKEQPYRILGLRLRGLRQKSQESMAEVSGAVEIEIDELERFEQGAKLPSEDILLLLISHFGIRDDEAVGIWELAGYDCSDKGAEQTPTLNKQPVVMLLGLDSRVVYSNGIGVSADPSGVVLNFTQYVDPTQQPVPIARVGMSRDQAEKVLETLQQALLRDKYAQDQKCLPAPKNTKAKAVRPTKRKFKADER